MVQAFNAFAYFVFLWLGDRFKLRCLMSTIPSTISTLGTLLVWLLPESMSLGRLIGFILSVPPSSKLGCMPSADPAVLFNISSSMQRQCP